MLIQKFMFVLSPITDKFMLLILHASLDGDAVSYIGHNQRLRRGSCVYSYLSSIVRTFNVLLISSKIDLLRIIANIIIL